MSQLELLKKVLDVLDSIEVPFMLTGALVSSMQGIPRMTHDIDIVVVLDEHKAEKLARFFPEPDYCLDGASAREAVKLKSSSNLSTMRVSSVLFPGKMLWDKKWDAGRFRGRVRQDRPPNLPGAPSSGRYPPVPHSPDRQVRDEACLQESGDGDHHESHGVGQFGRDPPHRPHQQQPCREQGGSRRERARV